MSTDRVLKFRTPMQCVNGHFFFDYSILIRGVLLSDPHPCDECIAALGRVVGRAVLGQSQQFTGWRDRNKRDAYEDDLIQRNDDSEWIIFWDSGRCGFYWQNTATLREEYVDWACLAVSTVLGNRFENPELYAREEQANVNPNR